MRKLHTQKPVSTMLWYIVIVNVIISTGKWCVSILHKTSIIIRSCKVSNPWDFIEWLHRLHIRQVHISVLLLLRRLSNIRAIRQSQFQSRDFAQSYSTWRLKAHWNGTQVLFMIDHLYAFLVNDFFMDLLSCGFIGYVKYKMFIALCTWTVRLAWYNVARSKDFCLNTTVMFVGERDVYHTGLTYWGRVTHICVNRPDYHWFK